MTAFTIQQIEGDASFDHLAATTALPPFLVGDPTPLRRKIEGFTGIWKKRWSHFLKLAGSEKRQIYWYAGSNIGVPMHAALAWLATGGREWAEIAARDLRWMRDKYEETLDVGNQDHDTWIYGAVMARRAMSLDWIWDSGALTPEERDEFADLFITDSFKYPYVTLHNRVPPHANNQGMAMALNLVVIGWLYGFRRGSDPRARHLLEVGLPHLLQQVAYLPPGGYSGEGSTYVVLVADPLTALACAVLEEISGCDFLHREFWPSRNSIGQILELNAKLVPPSGVLPAWDQHGFMLQRAGATACYLAHRTGNPAYAYPYLYGPGWEFSSSFAWLRDDHVWQLIWMPDPALTAPPKRGVDCYPECWAEERVGGALQDDASTNRLFQMWDISGSRPTRGHMNPNSLLLEAWGSLLTVDGNAAPEGFPLEEDPRMQYWHLYSTSPKTLSWASGSLGAHSCIIVDGAIELTPRSPGYVNLPGEVPTGWLRRLEAAPGRKVLASEVAPFYQSRFDIESCIRTSALLDERFWVVLDQISSGSPHAYTWQLVLRHGATQTSFGTRLHTAEQVVLDVIHLDGLAPELHDIPGYPSTLEQRCHHLRKHANPTSAAEFLTVLIPRLARKKLTDWSGGWMLRPDPENVGVAEKWEKDGAAQEWQKGRLEDAYYVREESFGPAHDQESPDRTVVWFTQEVSLPPMEANICWWLELPRTAGSDLWIDGHALEVPPLAGFHQPESRLQAPFVDVTKAMAGKDKVRITLRIHHQSKFGLMGGVRLHKGITLPSPVVERQGDRVVVEFDGQRSEFELSSLRTAAAPIPDPQPEGDEPVAAGRELLGRLSLLEAPASCFGGEGTPSARMRWCAAAMRRPLDEVEDELLGLARDPEWTVRMMAVRALGELSSSRAVPVIIEVLQAEIPEALLNERDRARFRVKELCLVALGMLGDPRAADAVAACLDEREFYGVRRIAADLLGKLGDARYLELLAAWANDPDAETANGARRSTEKLNSLIPRHAT